MFNSVPPTPPTSTGAPKVDQIQLQSHYLSSKSFLNIAFALLTILILGHANAIEVSDNNPQDIEGSNTISANIAIVNNYVFRGLSQTNFNPAIQGGIEYAHTSGFYIGNWNSNISWISNTYGTGGYIYGKSTPGHTVRAPIELDFYAGFRSEWLAKGYASDIGIITYYYPTSGIPNTDGYFTNPNSTEIYAAQNYTLGPVTGNFKFSYAVTTLFGTANSAGSFYPEFNIEYDTGFYGLALSGHIGYQRYAGHIQNQNGDNYAIYYSGDQIPNGTSNNSLYSYADWKLGVSKTFEEKIILTLAYSGTNAKNFGANGYAFTSPQGKNLAGSQGIISLTKLF